MKSFLFVAVCALLVGGCNKTSFPETQQGGEMPRSILDPYLKIQQALAEDSVEGVRQNAGELTTAATALGAPGMKIYTEAAQLTSAGELEDARAKFGRVSEAIDTYMKGFHMTAPEGVRLAWCPMASKPWLQEGSVLQNPYEGKAMPTCGEFR
jgi:hypothetical protein